jgi:predicted small lipoprotein YifL
MEHRLVSFDRSSKSGQGRQLEEGQGSRMRLVVLFRMSLVVAIAISLTGCGDSSAKGPKTIPVQGKLVFMKGGNVKTLADRQARIEFESVDQPGLRAVGPIAEDGSFTVATVAEEGGSQGAVPGTHRVRLLLDERDEKFVAPQFLDFVKSGLKITIPSDKPIEIQIWR